MVKIVESTPNKQLEKAESAETDFSQTFIYFSPYFQLRAKETPETKVTNLVTQ